MGMQDILDSAKSLPAAERLCIVDELLRTLNAEESSIDEAWAIECERRLDQVRTGEVTPIPGEEVFARIRARYGEV